MNEINSDERRFQVEPSIPPGNEGSSPEAVQRRKDRALRAELERFATLKRKILFTGFAIMFLMGLFPPWNERVTMPEITFSENVGYALIFEPPARKGVGTVSVDVGRLVLQWVITCLAMAAYLKYIPAPVTGGQASTKQ